MQRLESWLAWIVRISLWLIPLLPLYVSSTMLFPFITGKNFTFRFLVEIAFACWVALAVLKSAYRPKLTPLFKIITIFVGIVFLADLFSPHPYRSFFSNYERMEGFMMIGHLYLYFIMLASVFKSKRDWLVFFHVSLAASIYASVYGLLQRLGYYPSLQGGFRVDSTIGNPTYFAAYLLFHIWLLALFIYQYRKKLWLTAFYGALFVFELVMIYFTATRGVVLALIITVIPLGAIVVAFWERAFGPGRQRWSKARIATAAVLGCMVLVPVFFWGISGTKVVRENQALHRLTNYSFQDDSTKNRLMIWKMSLQGVVERPILGWGQENYYLVFQKYFNPGLWHAEQWFDRSHNVLLDWAVHTGILGLGAYLGIFFVILRELIRAMRRRREIFFASLLLIGLFVTYFLQNLFVFDNLNSYLLFFAFLAYSAYMIESDIVIQKKSPERRVSNRQPYAVGVVLVMLLLIAVWGYMTILKPIRESTALIRVLNLIQRRAPIGQVQAAFADTLSYRAFGDTEAHEQLGSYARDIAGGEAGTPDERRSLVDFALDELHKETGRPAKDVKHLLFIASILDRALVLDMRYATEARAAIEEAKRLSPTKQPVYFELAQLDLSLSRVDDALEALLQAWRLERHFPDAAGNLWIVAIFAKNQAVIDEVQRDMPLSTDYPEDKVLGIAQAYQQVQDLDNTLKIYGFLVQASGNNPQYHATYAALLARAGKIVEARQEVEEAIRLDPSFEKEGRAFLQRLQ